MSAPSNLKSGRRRYPGRIPQPAGHRTPDISPNINLPPRPSADGPPPAPLPSAATPPQANPFTETWAALYRARTIPNIANLFNGLSAGNIGANTIQRNLIQNLFSLSQSDPHNYLANYRATTTFNPQVSRAIQDGFYAHNNPQRVVYEDQGRRAQGWDGRP